MFQPLLGIASQIQTLLDRWTQAKADFLDVSVLSRASQNSVNSIPTNPLLTNDARLGNLNAPLGNIPTTAIKSIHHGYINNVSSNSAGAGIDNAYKNVDITSYGINYLKCIVIFHGSGSFANGANGFFENANSQYILHARLTSDANLRVHTPRAAGGAGFYMTGMWTVIEFN